MNLAIITPLILAYNEEENIDRCLEALAWATQIIVVDSFSTDRTLEICARFPKVRVIQRAFDTAAQQGNFGLEHVTTEWVLSMDSDYISTDAVVAEISAMDPSSSINGYWAPFTYCVFGKSLRGTLYPPRKVLYRRAEATYHDDGHTQRVSVTGGESNLTSPLLHDDRKPISRWFNSQSRYARLEAVKLLAADPASLRPQERIRRLRWAAPLLSLVWCLVVRGCILDGRAGIYYAFQRVLAELMLSVSLLDDDLRRSPDAHET